MTPLFSLLLTFLFVFLNPTTDADLITSIDPVVAAIDSGSSSELARYFDSSVSLNINGQQGDYSKNQAELVVKDFFRKNPPMGFSLLFRSESNPKLSSYIGDYQTGQGTFKVFIKVSQEGSDIKVYSLEFVKS